MRFDFRLLVAAFSLLIASPVSGQYPRDTAANKKIDEALNVHYLATEFKKAEAVLLGTIEACETKCRSSTIGRAWMYVGVVRGSGNQDQAKAREAFEKALEADPAVTLDGALATPETKATFEALGGQTRPEDSPPMEPPPSSGEGSRPAPAVDAPVGSSKGLACTPGSIGVQTRRPIPVACTGDAEATSMSLRYREFGGDTWVTVNMTKVAGTFQGEIPCDATRMAGPLAYFVVATDAGGDPVDTLGSKSNPVTISVAAQVADEAPAFPGQAPPPRCAVEEICPPDFPGCGAGEGTVNRGEKEWGASCEQSAECQSGLLCVDGSCETAPSCVVDTDCETGVCRAGKCDLPSDKAAPVDAYPRNSIGLHFALDVGFLGGKDVCRAGQTEYDCYLAGTSNPYPPPLPDGVGSDGEPGDAYPGAGIGNGLSSGSMRIVASYDRAVSANFTLGARAGFAFGGGPARPGGSSFLPVHLEARAQYWFLGLVGGPVRPYAHLTGGMAQVDLKTEVVVSDCSEESSYDDFIDCIEATGAYDSANNPDLPSKSLDAYKKLGKAFVGVGAGVVFAAGENLGAQLNLNLMYLLPDSGLVLQPSLGAVYAF